MLKKRYLIGILLLILTLLVSCSSKNVTSQANSTMGHTNMDNMNMDNMSSENSNVSMEKPIPKTKDQKEVHQQIYEPIKIWHKKNIKGTNVKIAVLDTGVDIKNKDLHISKGINYVGKDVNNFNDDNGHGTKVAGIIGALENDYNLLGIAPKSELFIGKVADKNGFSKKADLIKGINWAINEKVDVINISLEFNEGSEELEKAIKKAHNNNIIVVSSSGNIKYPGDKTFTYPGKYPECISVGMLNTKGKVYSKEFIEKKPDVLAPSEDIFSLYLGNKMTLDTGVSFGTAYTSGYSALLINYYKKNGIKYNRDIVLKDLKKYLDQNVNL